MTAVTSILVDIDAAAADQPALDQAVGLAARCGARVKIVDVLPPVPAGARHFVTVDRENDLVEHRVQRLRTIAEGVNQATVTAELLRGRPGTALIQEVLRSGHDLLVRSHGRGPMTGRRPFGAIDMELLRQCPCPVWIIAPRSTQHRPWRILAAVHANPTDAGEQALNRTILDWALTLKEFGDAQLTVVQAWTVYGGSLLRSRLPAAEYTEFVEAARRAENEALQGVLEPCRDRLRDVAVELMPGEAEDAITAFVESHEVDVVVMGTVARSGIAGLVMGNTAERVLLRLCGSVLAVKPPGFETPVARP